MGDPACWLEQTCLGCGRFLDADQREGDRCPHCGAELSGGAR
jgi:rRNA maturation endonuclease Nob1